MNYMETIRRNQAKRHGRRARAAFMETAALWLMAIGLAVAAIPAAVIFGMALALSASI